MQVARSFLTIVVSVYLFSALAPPAGASCVVGGVMDTAGEYLISNPEWGGVGGLGTCYWYGCYASESEPPISPSFDGVFWAFGHGDPRFGYGIDNGSLSIDRWSKARRCTTADGCLETYYYSAWLTLDTPGEPNWLPGSPVNWTLSGIDGCILDIGEPWPGSGGCLCVLLSDQWHGRSFFSVLSAYRSPLGTFELITGDVIRLGPLPPLQPGPTDGLHIVVPPPEVPTDSLFLRGCPCTILGYKVYEQVVPAGTAPPEDRSVESGWQIADGGALESGEPIPLDSEAGIRCSATGDNVSYLAYTLVFDSGFELPVVSENSPPVTDCPTLSPFSELSFTQIFVRYDAASDGGDGFELRGTFTLDPQSDGIEPSRESVVLTVGPSTIAIPAGSFQPNGWGVGFLGVLDSVEVQSEFRETGAGSFAFRFGVHQVDLSGTTNPLEVRLAIGNDSGEALVRLGGLLMLDPSTAERPRIRVVGPQPAPTLDRLVEPGRR